jgi:hypothetical protein
VARRWLLLTMYPLPPVFSVCIANAGVTAIGGVCIADKGVSWAACLCHANKGVMGIVDGQFFGVFSSDYRKVETGSILDGYC